ncbi:alpha-L-fucosidase [Mariniflexile fucanivorans]|uniref:alpha-L-fucosidase n=1 Tax=Mariniflexile fucanivorans TaxID=264023 RepID=A0A4R1RNT7_9FLAO|nr:alpha-L-fucosidase [Mariniflexile fucanivorans]TCL67906.1 alpha-L-fucosidase [Mariniflexile fucanivorans]
MKTLKYITVLIFIFAIFSCKNTPKNEAVNEKPFDQTTNWIVLEKSNTTQEADKFTWKFDVKHPADYVVQMVFDKLPTDTVSVEVAGQKFKEVLHADYKINSNKIVSEFQKTVKFSNTGNQIISIETKSDFNKIRIIPHYKNPMGSGKYDEEWLAMHQSPEKKAALNWFKEAKFGMFIHWGLYSQAGGIWNGVKINDVSQPGPKVAEWLMHAFQISRNEYKELAKTFNPDKSFAQNIAKLAKDAGMKYVVITSKHHDGFALFDSKYSEYDMADATPYKGDLVKELYDACLAEELDFGVYYSHGNDWMDGTDGNYANIKKVNDSLGIYTHPSGKNLWDPSPNTHAEYLESKAYPQIKELISMLPELKLIWFDGEGFITEDQSFKFYKMVYDLNPHILVNRRIGWGFGDYEDAGDNKIPSANEVVNKYWETCGTTNNSWGFKSYDHDWKSTKETLYYIVDIASKGGNYLLNIGPDGKGDVPVESKNILREVGTWMHTNGEAIYGTKRWSISSSEGQEETLLDGTTHREGKGFKKTFTSNDFWFTTKENNVYAISLVKPLGEITIKSFKKDIGKITGVKILGNDNEVEWNQNETGLKVNLKGIESNENGFVVKIVMALK